MRRLGAGLGCGVLTALFAIITAIADQQLFPFAFMLALGAVFTTYFVWLIVLRKQMNGNSRNLKRTGLTGLVTRARNIFNNQQPRASRTRRAPFRRSAAAVSRGEIVFAISWL
jgi:hypothetical protein